MHFTFASHYRTPQECFGKASFSRIQGICGGVGRSGGIGQCYGTLVSTFAYFLALEGGLGAGRCLHPNWIFL